MYLGRIVERGTVDEVLRAPRHPYTRALLSAVPVVDPGSRREIIRLEGELPSPANPPRGCHFHPRCPEAMPRCRESYPGTTAFTGTHRACCFLYGDSVRGDSAGAKPGTRTGIADAERQSEAGAGS